MPSQWSTKRVLSLWAYVTVFATVLLVRVLLAVWAHIKSVCNYIIGQSVWDYAIVNMIVITVSFSQNVGSLRICKSVWNYIFGLGVVTLSICHCVCNCINIQSADGILNISQSVCKCIFGQRIRDYVIVNMIVAISMSFSQNVVSLSTCQTVCNYIFCLGVVTLSICHSVCNYIIGQSVNGSLSISQCVCKLVRAFETASLLIWLWLSLWASVRMLSVWAHVRLFAITLFA